MSWFILATKGDVRRMSANAFHNTQLHSAGTWQIILSFTLSTIINPLPINHYFLTDCPAVGASSYFSRFIPLVAGSSLSVEPSFANHLCVPWRHSRENLQSS